MEVEIVKFDNLGRGIGYINNKIIFVPKTVPGDIINVEIINEHSKYYEGKIIDIVKLSKKRIDSICPFFNKCGGCDLLHISLSDRLEYKLEKVRDILNNNKISCNVTKISKSDDSYNYRNKITLKVENTIIGLYENSTHDIVKIDNCLLCNDKINEVLKDIHKLNIIDGEIVIRSNYKGDLLISINSNDKVENIDYFVDNYLVVGIVQNNKCIYGQDYFIDKINDYLFKVSYNSFFQINPYICSKLFNLIKENTIDSKNILDLYCGVGTLSIVAKNESNHVLGVEINENAIKDANLNKCLNKIDNIDFICSDTKNILDKISSDYDTVILDPPRSGVEDNVLSKIINENINKIIYVSCNPSTLARDLVKLEKSYDIKHIELLDMFPNTHHVETVCIMNLKKC